MLRSIGPGMMGGLTFGKWIQVLRENNFAVTPSCLPRAMAITVLSLQNTIFHWADQRRLGTDLQDVVVPPPLFVLGHWRNGTTFLHNLLTVDERFAFPNSYQTLFPNSCLTAEAMLSPLFNFLLPKRRTIDNVARNMRSPQEDEFALSILSFKSPYTGFVFPHRREHYDKYLTLRDVSGREIAEWQDTFSLFLKKMTWKLKRPLILKSPPHTCRIKLILQMFPQAKFVHIHRNPYAVFSSSRKMFQANFDWHGLQRARLDDLDDWVLRQYREMYDVFFEERHLIPSGHFHEIAFEELEQDPLGQVQRLYEALELPEFSQCETAMRSYVASLAGYQKNQFPSLPSELRQRIAQEWQASFTEWGYSQ